MGAEEAGAWPTRAGRAEYGAPSHGARKHEDKRRGHNVARGIASGGMAVSKQASKQWFKCRTLPTPTASTVPRPFAGRV